MTSTSEWLASVSPFTRLDNLPAFGVEALQHAATLEALDHSLGNAPATGQRPVMRQLNEHSNEKFFFVFL
jgi:hypothetical protein